MTFGDNANRYMGRNRTERSETTAAGFSRARTRRGSDMAARTNGPLVLAATLSVLAPTHAFSEVDADCLESSDAFVCAPERLEDARLADRIAQPVLAKAGWAHVCYRVLISKGDEGDAGTLLVLVDGSKGAPESWCQVPVVEGLTADEVASIRRRGGSLQHVVSATAEKSARKGADNAATPDQVKEIGKALKNAILAAPPTTRSRVLRGVKQLSVGNGYGADVDLPLP
jgi:hypothetical protein